MKTVCIAAALAVAGMAAAASAQLIEGFEHGNAGLYTTAGGVNPNFNLVGAAARTGNFGAEFGNVTGPFWYYRTDLTTAPGNEYYVYVRTGMGGGGVSTGRVYVGVGASAGGTYSMIAAPNTSQIILQQNLGWGFVNLAVAPFTFASNTWYQMRLDWAANGDMTVRLYDEPGTTLLAATPTASTGFTTPGGVAFRGFTTSDAFSHADDFGRVPSPAGLMVLAGLLPLARRRRA